MLQLLSEPYKLLLVAESKESLFSLGGKSVTQQFYNYFLLVIEQNKYVFLVRR